MLKKGEKEKREKCGYGGLPALPAPPPNKKEKKGKHIVGQQLWPTQNWHQFSQIHRPWKCCKSVRWRWNLPLLRSIVVDMPSVDVFPKIQHGSGYSPFGSGDHVTIKAWNWTHSIKATEFNSSYQWPLFKFLDFLFEKYNII